MTSSTDRGGEFNAGADNDEFLAYLQQNPTAGGVSNSLSSADVLDGGAGTDSLFAEIVPEFFGTSGNNQIDIQVRTSNIENITFEARDSGSNDANDGANTVVTVDAKNMIDVDRIGSSYSDGDLVIENLTTQSAEGDRNTADLTITMDHTDNFNSDGDASDLTVYLDEDYLINDSSTGGATLTIRMVNAVTNVAGDNPIDGITELDFMVGTELVTVDVSALAVIDSLVGLAAYTAVVAAINDQLVLQGLTEVTAALSTAENAVFSIPVLTFNTGDAAGTQPESIDLRYLNTS